MTLIFIYFLLGGIAGFLSGLLGIGGGLILVPGLSFVFSRFDVTHESHIMHISIATSLASSIVNLLIGVRTHHLRNAVKWPIFKAMAPGVLLGSLIIGPSILLFIKGEQLRILFGIFCLLIFLQMTFFKNQTSEEKLPGYWFLSGIGFVTGTISTILGIAGGAIISAMLHYYQLDAKKVVGTTSAVSAIIAVSGTLGLLFTSYSEVQLPPYSTGYIYWPAFICIASASLLITPLGARLAHKMPSSLLKFIFSMLILIIGLKMIFFK